jgi:2,4-dienoyl-CoA reductase-like NADH-dependent reductase (Old Yellow Enzyme family)
MAFNLLFSPLKIGSLTLPNRLVMPPMTTNLAGEDGKFSDPLIDFYAVRAQGGVGMIVVELSIVSIEGKRLPYNVGIWDDGHVEGLSRLAKAIKEAGSIAAIQIGHGGRESNSAFTGRTPVAPSALPSIFRGTTAEVEKPIELDLAGIDRLKSDFVRAARRAQDAGFQAVEIHGAHGYLVAQFLSSSTNKRTDAYGGIPENRARFLVEIIEGIKKDFGQDLAVVARFNGNDYVDDGNTEADAIKIALCAQKAGADAIHVSAGFHQSRPYKMIPAMDLEDACLVPLAQAVKEEVDIPVIAVAKIGRPELAEEILAEQRADLIAMGRPLICDPQLPLKASQNRPETVRYCIWCNQGCIGQIHHLKSITCLQTPVAGREGELKPTKSASSNRILVIGGGPAGMAASAALAGVGHRVTLAEKSEELGGQLNIACLPPTREAANDRRAPARSDHSGCGFAPR